VHRSSCRIRNDGRLRPVRDAGKHTPSADIAPEGECRLAGHHALEDALRECQEQLRQAERLAAIGRLAGGVAHDFNNLLTAIFGYAELLLDQFPDEDPRRRDVEEIRRSAERAAALTRQLLAFTRKQTVQRRTIDLNEVVWGIAGLVTRLVTGDVRVSIRAGEEVWPVRADSGEIEQILMNLAANARDAMPNGGNLRIETGNRTIAESDGIDLPPGDYVSLSVSDTGLGIPQAVRDRIFEPFFTTKASDKGTGLGLATVYTIVKQAGGAIQVDSGPGAGTRFAIFLPRATSSL
jgi:two-component system, cell cycle sensor histidine kinase and response regulator CckA